MQIEIEQHKTGGLWCRAGPVSAKSTECALKMGVIFSSSFIFYSLAAANLNRNMNNS